jgi:carbonic anhydrase/acetyltransferase-like protein (isoleucine patch superfamily)
MIEVPAVPMLGGGCYIHGKGTGTDAVVIEGAFIGSNAIIKSGSVVGFGSFVLGQLGPDEGLLPFTISTQQGQTKDEIGGVLKKFSNVVVTHFISWTYQSLPRGQAADVTHLVRGQIARGINAIHSEFERRQKGLPWNTNVDFAKYKSLPFYSDKQLRDGLRIYEECIEKGCWDLVFDGRNLSFANVKGHWIEKNGHLLWQKRTSGTKTHMHFK